VDSSIPCAHARSPVAYLTWDHPSMDLSTRSIHVLAATRNPDERSAVATLALL
jgi:hypothetical protein